MGKPWTSELLLLVLSPIRHDGAMAMLQTPFHDVLGLDIWVKSLPVTEAARIAAATPILLDVPGVGLMQPCGHNRVPNLPGLLWDPKHHTLIRSHGTWVRGFPYVFCTVRALD